MNKDGEALKYLRDKFRRLSETIKPFTDENFELVFQGNEQPTRLESL